MILLIYPQDPTIRRIERHGKRIARSLSGVSERIVIEPKDASKIRAHHAIKASDDGDLIVFMGHGRSDALFGARGNRYKDAEYVDYRVIEETPELYYNDENFIDSATYRLLVGKKIVSFACVSNELGKRLVSAGTKAALGFGKLPTTIAEFKDEWHINNVNMHMVAAMSGILDVSFGRALIRAVKQGGNMTDLAYCIKDEIHWHIAMLLYSRARYRYLLASVLYEVEKEVVVIGDATLPLL